MKGREEGERQRERQETARLPRLERKTKERESGGGKTFLLLPSPPLSLSLSFLFRFLLFPHKTLNKKTRMKNVDRNGKKKLKFKQDSTHVFLALEFVRGGEFFRHLRARGRLPEAAARAYAAEVVVALEAMHDRGVVYRDLKVCWWGERVCSFSSLIKRLFS